MITSILQTLMSLSVLIVTLYIIYRWQNIQLKAKYEHIKYVENLRAQQKKRAILYKRNLAELKKRSAILTEKDLADAYYKLATFDFPIFKDMS